MNVNIWDVKGYVGRDEPDPNEWNHHFTIAMDAKLTEKEVIKFLHSKYTQPWCYTCFKISLIETKAIK